MKIKFLLLIPVIAISSSFRKEETKENQTALQQKVASQNLNISFLLDLSDRIDPKKYPGYYQRDIQYIKSVEKAFLSNVKQKKIITLNDQMQVFFDPQPKSFEINELSKQLKVSFDKFSSKKDIDNVDKVFSEIPVKIYQSAIKDGQYIGSDIWRFFKTKVQDYCIKDKHRNILVILTDGYMYHKDSKLIDKNKSSYITPAFIQAKKLTSANYKSIIQNNQLGFIPATNNLQDLEVLILGVNPSKKNPYEEDVINQYWTDWFNAMNIKKFQIKTADLPSDLDPVIQRIILGK